MLFKAAATAKGLLSAVYSDAEDFARAPLVKDVVIVVVPEIQEGRQGAEADLDPDLSRIRFRADGRVSTTSATVSRRAAAPDASRCVSLGSAFPLPSLPWRSPARPGAYRSEALPGAYHDTLPVRFRHMSFPPLREYSWAPDVIWVKVAHISRVAAFF